MKGLIFCAERSGSLDVPAIEAVTGNFLRRARMRLWPTRLVHLQTSYLSHMFSDPSGDVALIMVSIPGSPGRTTIRCSLLSTQHVKLSASSIDKLKYDILENVKRLESQYLELIQGQEM